MDQPIVVEECAGLARRGEVIRFCLPFAAGEWAESDVLGFRASQGDGEVVATSVRVTSQWPDGSARLATCALAVNLAAQARLSLLPEPGLISPAVPDLLPGAALEALQIRVLDSRRIQEMRLEVDTAGPGFALLRPLTAASRKLAITGSVASMGGHDRMVQLTTLNQSLEPLTLRSIRLALSAATLLATPPRECELGNRGSRHSAGERPEFLQLTRVGELGARGGAVEKTQYPLGGECRQNPIWLRAYAEGTGATAAIRNFGENFPCGASVDRDLLCFDLWPEQAGLLVLEPGMEKTHCLGVVWDTGGPEAGGFEAAQRIHLPLVAVLPVERLNLLECFPPLASYLPTRYPKLEVWSKWVMANRPRSYGFFDFGDEPNFSYLARAEDTERTYSLNNEYDYPFVALAQFCRAGDRLWHEDGRAAALHMMDMDTATVHPDTAAVGGQYAHSQGHTASGPHPDHEWLEGLLLYHLLTADDRALRYARALATRLAGLAERGDFDSVGMTARRYGWPLIALCSFHRFSGVDRYLVAARRIVAGMKRVELAAGGLRSPYWSTPYWSLDTFMLGIAAAGLCRFHRIVGDDESAAMIVSSCDALLSMASPEGIFNYKEYPLVRLPEVAAGSLCLEALAYGYELAGNREYLAVGARNLEYLVEATRSGVHIHWNAEERTDTSAEDDRPAAYMRARFEELTAQYIGVAHRGLWPFMATAEKAGFYTPSNNPFAFISDNRTPGD